MNILNAITTSVLNLRLVDVVQILGIVFLILYLVFALVILRQVQLMTRTVITALSPLLIFIAIVHIGVILAILILFITVF